MLYEQYLAQTWARYESVHRLSGINFDPHVPKSPLT